MSAVLREQQRVTGQSPNLDFLRSVAVLAVFADHLMSTFGFRDALGLDLWKLGRLGVLMFFVHTSLVLVLSLDRLRQPGAGNMFAAFYVRRFFRIYPLSIVCVLAVVALHIPSAPWRPQYYWPGWPTLISNLALTQNLTFSESVLGPLWSLPYEIQMYLVLPAIYLLLRWKRGLFPLIALWGAALAAALAQPHLTARLDFVKFAPCFMGGVASYWFMQRYRPRLPFILWPVVMLAAMVEFVVFDHERTGWVMCAILGLAVPHFRDMNVRWLGSASHTVAKYSYGIYLAHIIAMWLAFVQLKTYPAWAQWGIFAVVAAGLPVAAYHLLEHPMIRLGSVISGNIAHGFRPALLRTMAASAAGPAPSAGTD